MSYKQNIFTDLPDRVNKTMPTLIPISRDASSGLFPTVIPGNPGRWKITVAGTLPAPVGAVNVGDELFYDGAVRSALYHPIVPAWSWVSATNQLLINTTEPEVVGKQYQSIANANAYAAANPLQQFQTLIVGEITEDVQLIGNNTITGLDNRKSYINGTVTNAMFGGTFFSSFISNVRIKEFQGSPFGLTILNKCWVEKVSNLEWSIGFITLDSLIQSDSSDFRTLTPTQTGIIMFSGRLQAITSNSYLQFNDRVQLTNVQSLGGSTTLDFSECEDVTTFGLDGQFANIMYPDVHPAKVSIIKSKIYSQNELSVASITGDNTQLPNIVTVVTNYKHQLKWGNTIDSINRDDSSFDQYSAAITYVDDYTFTYPCPWVSNGTTTNGDIRRKIRTTELTLPWDDWTLKDSDVPWDFLVNAWIIRTQKIGSANGIQAFFPGVREDLGDLIDISGMPLLTKKETHWAIKEIYALLGGNIWPQPILYRDELTMGADRQAVEAAYGIDALTNPVTVIYVPIPGTSPACTFAWWAIYTNTKIVDLVLPDNCVMTITDDTRITTSFKSIKGKDIVLDNLNAVISPSYTSGTKISMELDGVTIKSKFVPLISQNGAPGTSDWIDIRGNWISEYNGSANFYLNPNTPSANYIFEVGQWEIKLNTISWGNDGTAVTYIPAQSQYYTSERQSVGFSPIAVSGTYTLEHNGNVTNPLNYDADATVLTAEITARWVDYANVTVSGDRFVGFTIKMLDIPSSIWAIAIQITNNTMVDGNSDPVTATQSFISNAQFANTSVEIAPDAIGWVFFFTYNGVTGNPLAWNANAFDIRNELISLTGLATLVALWDLNNGIYIWWNELYTEPGPLILDTQWLICTPTTLIMSPKTANAKISETQSWYNGVVSIKAWVYLQHMTRVVEQCSGGGRLSLLEEDVVVLEDDLTVLTLKNTQKDKQITVIATKANQTVSTGNVTLFFDWCGFSWISDLLMHTGETLTVVNIGWLYRQVLERNPVMQIGGQTPFGNVMPRFQGETFYDSTANQYRVATGILTVNDWYSPGVAIPNVFTWDAATQTYDDFYITNNIATATGDVYVYLLGLWHQINTGFYPTTAKAMYLVGDGSNYYKQSVVIINDWAVFPNAHPMPLTSVLMEKRWLGASLNSAWWKALVSVWENCAMTLGSYAERYSADMEVDLYNKGIVSGQIGTPQFLSVGFVANYWWFTDIRINPSTSNPLSLNGGLYGLDCYDNTWTQVGWGQITSHNTDTPTIDYYGSEPYVAYTDKDTNQVVVQKYSSGTRWLLWATGLPTGDYFDCNFRIDSAGIAYLAVTDASGNMLVLSVDLNSPTAWTQIGSFWPSAYAPFMDIDSTNKIYLTYVAGTTQTLAVRDGLAWTQLFTSPSNGFSDVSVVNDVPYVVVANVVSPTVTDLKVYSYDTVLLKETWIGDVVSNNGESPQIKAILNSNSDIELYVSYIDNKFGGKLTLKKINLTTDTEWKVVGYEWGQSYDTVARPSLDGITGTLFVYYVNNWVGAQTFDLSSQLKKFNIDYSAPSAALFRQTNGNQTFQIFAYGGAIYDYTFYTDQTTTRLINNNFCPSHLETQSQFLWPVSMINRNSSKGLDYKWYNKSFAENTEDFLEKLSGGYWNVKEEIADFTVTKLHNLVLVNSNVPITAALPDIALSTDYDEVSRWFKNVGADIVTLYASGWTFEDGSVLYNIIPGEAVKVVVKGKTFYILRKKEWPSVDSEMYIAGNSTPISTLVIDNEPFPLAIANIQYGQYNGISPTAPNITSSGITGFTDYSGTVPWTVLATCSTIHWLSTGDFPYIQDSSSYYNGRYLITRVDDYTFYFTSSFLGDAPWQRNIGDYELIAYPGVYNYEAKIKFYTANDICRVTAYVYVNDQIQPQTEDTASTGIVDEDIRTLHPQGRIACVAWDKVQIFLIIDNALATFVPMNINRKMELMRQVITH